MPKLQRRRFTDSEEIPPGHDAWVVGDHTGEVEIVQGGIFGVAVHAAARIRSLAGSSGVLVSWTTRDSSQARTSASNHAGITR